MRKSAVLVLVVLSSVALASNAMAQQYDRYEKYGDEAFKPYAEQFGPLDEGLKRTIAYFRTTL